MKAVRSTGDLATMVTIDDLDEPPDREMEDAAAMLADHPEIVDTIITHRFPLEDAPEAFRVAADKTTKAIRVVLEP